MSVREMSLSRVLLSTLIALAALVLAAPAVSAAPADPPDTQSEEKDAEEKKTGEEQSADAKKSGDAKSADEQQPVVGGDASVPRPRTRKPLPTKVDPKTGQKVLVLTNDGLVERFGETKRQLPSAAVPYGEVEEQKESADAAPAEQADNDRRIVEIRRDLRRLRQNLLRYRNPLLPRPQLSEEEQAEQAGRDNVERIAMTESRIADLERELAELQAQRGAID